MIVAFFKTKEKALEIAKDLGCEGYHEHEFEGETWYMPWSFTKRGHGLPQMPKGL
ncbi:MAG: hypothetical protein CM15mV122_070 [uncultured marine virus]|nr:MAG: hypothetical protein CM15mV122_070 [uncultured marine virus]